VNKLEIHYPDLEYWWGPDPSALWDRQLLLTEYFLESDLRAWPEISQSESKIRICF
jgi:hypothetical protein